MQPDFTEGQVVNIALQYPVVWAG